MCMNWKRVKKERQRVADEHIVHMYTLALAAMDTHPDRSSRYITLIRAISKKHKVTLSRPMKQGICTACNMPLVPGKNASVRTRNATVVITCQHCGAVKRYPFRRERALRRSTREGCCEIKAQGGLLQATVTVSGGKIRSLSVSGDYFLHPDTAMHDLEDVLRFVPVSCVADRVSEFFAATSVDMPGVTIGDITSVIQGAITAAMGKKE